MALKTKIVSVSTEEIMSYVSACILLAGLADKNNEFFFSQIRYLIGKTNLLLINNNDIEDILDVLVLKQAIQLIGKERMKIIDADPLINSIKKIIPK
jgi:hypothetical protein